MPAYASKGYLVNYITSEGFRQSKIVSMAQIDDKIYYRLENSDCVRETPIGLVKTYESDDILRLFGESFEGKNE